MKVNTFNFALKWALIIFGIALIASIPAISSIGEPRDTLTGTMVLTGIISVIAILGRIVVYIVAVIKYGRATENKLSPWEMWQFGGLLYLLVTGLSMVSFIILKAVMPEEPELPDTIGNGMDLSLMGFFFGLFFDLIFFLLSMLIAGQWRTFEKAGKPGWASIVPIYNYVVLAEIGKKPTWWVILLLIPLVNLVFYIMLLNAFVKSFSKDAGWTVGMLFLPFIFYPMLAWGNAQYIYSNSENLADLDVEDHLVE